MVLLAPLLVFPAANKEEPDGGPKKGRAKVAAIKSTLAAIVSPEAIIEITAAIQNATSKIMGRNPRNHHVSLGLVDSAAAT